MKGPAIEALEKFIKIRSKELSPSPWKELEKEAFLLMMVCNQHETYSESTLAWYWACNSLVTVYNN